MCGLLPVFENMGGSLGTYRARAKSQDGNSQKSLQIFMNDLKLPKE